jgi:hypothetical protein
MPHLFDMLDDDAQREILAELRLSATSEAIDRVGPKSVPVRGSAQRKRRRA